MHEWDDWREEESDWSEEEVEVCCKCGFLSLLEDGYCSSCLMELIDRVQTKTIERIEGV